MVPEKSKNKDVAWLAPALQLFGQLAIWLVFPIILALFLGKWLDERFGTEPKLYFLCVAISFVVTMGGLIRYAIKAVRKIDELGGEKSDEKKNKIEEK